ncbi:MAG: MBL fold metallo-hydrolase [Chloroflexi bacterium]|nr:MBL fold metallo-hydrolase [Chloroflexota bacterium]
MLQKRFVKSAVLNIFLFALFFTGIFFAPAQAWEQGELEIHHLYVDQADCTFIIGPTGKTLLVDCGEKTWNSHANADRVADYIMSRLGINTIDYFVATHYHADHIGYASEPPKGGIRYMIEDKGIVVKKIIDRGFENFGTTGGTLWKYQDWAESLKNRKEASEGTSMIDLGPGVIVDILALNGNGQIPPGDLSGVRSPPSENDYSISLKISYGPFDYFIAGDLSGETIKSSFGYTYNDIETSLAPQVGDIEVYKVSHHGSSHSSNEYFVSTLHPEVAIFSYGRNNKFHHPDPAVVDRLSRIADIYRLAEDGDTVVTSHGGDTYVVESSNTREHTYECDKLVPAATIASAEAYHNKKKLAAHKFNIPQEKKPAAKAPEKTGAESYDIEQPEPERAETSKPEISKLPSPAGKEKIPAETLKGAASDAGKVSYPSSINADFAIILKGKPVSGSVRDLDMNDGKYMALASSQGDGSKEYSKNKYYIDWAGSFCHNIQPGNIYKLTAEITGGSSVGTVVSIRYRDPKKNQWVDLEKIGLTPSVKKYMLDLTKAAPVLSRDREINLRFTTSSEKPGLEIRIDSLGLEPKYDIDN